MKLISFDIGIKNMAYCIFSSDLSANFKIVSWNVLNLMDSVEPEHICSCKNKPKTNEEIVQDQQKRFQEMRQRLLSQDARVD